VGVSVGLMVGAVDGEKVVGLFVKPTTVGTVVVGDAEKIN
jgi:hypothetical protein